MTKPASPRRNPQTNVDGFISARKCEELYFQISSLLFPSTSADQQEKECSAHL